MTSSSKRIYVIDDLCNGCRRCEMMCAFLHSGEFNPKKARIRIAKVEREGIDQPVISCGGPCGSEAKEPDCVEFCPTGALLFETPEEALPKIQEYYRVKQVQPFFRVIAPWKWPFPSWKEWPFEQEGGEAGE